jgi:hypothetical protein
MIRRRGSGHRNGYLRFNFFFDTLALFLRDGGFSGLYAETLSIMASSAFLVDGDNHHFLGRNNGGDERE